MKTEYDFDDHLLLDISAKVEIVLQGLRYAVLYKDIDVLRKCVIDLQDCIGTLDEIVEGKFD